MKKILLSSVLMVLSCLLSAAQADVAYKAHGLNFSPFLAGQNGGGFN